MKSRAVSFIRSSYLATFARSHRGVMSAAIGAAVLASSAAVCGAVVSGAFTTASSQQVTTTDVTIDKPSASVGDLMIATVAIHGGSSAVVSSVPSGWNLIASTTNDASLTLLSYWKVVGGSEPSRYQWVIDKQTTGEGAIVA